jgi:hypothetical protein
LKQQHHLVHNERQALILKILFHCDLDVTAF